MHEVVMPMEGNPHDGGVNNEFKDQCICTQYIGCYY
jgi:hypothetical protein